ncbi:MAG TPA: hypothetical protein PLO76_04215 [Elusimicrobiota bacterium]|nr:hypothetical protein [Elusimicrobiota bacterium]
MFGALIDAATKLGSSGAGSILLPALEGAAAGGLGGALTGQNPLKQALVGGVTGGAMGAFGGANGPLAQYLGVSGPVANALIGGVLGAGGNKLMGLDPLVGAGMGALGGYGYGMQTAPSTDMPTTAENPANQGLLDTLRSNDTATTQAMSETASGRGGGPLGAAAASGNTAPPARDRQYNGRSLDGAAAVKKKKATAGKSFRTPGHTLFGKALRTADRAPAPTKIPTGGPATRSVSNQSSKAAARPRTSKRDSNPPRKAQVTSTKDWAHWSQAPRNNGINRIRQRKTA